MTAPARCPTGHRQARSVHLEPKPDERRRGELVVWQWSWCPECRSAVRRVLVIQYVGVYHPPPPGEPLPPAFVAPPAA